MPLAQHSPIFGHIDSSQTVARRCERTVRRTVAYFSPPGSRALSHGGLGNGAASSATARCFTPFLIAEKPCAVRYLAPETVSGTPRNSLTWTDMIRLRGREVSHGLSGASQCPNRSGCHSPSASRACERRRPGGARRLFEQADLAFEGARAANAELLAPGSFDRGLDAYRDAEADLESAAEASTVSATRSPRRRSASPRPLRPLNGRAPPWPP